MNWHCLDCPNKECTNQKHAWAEVELVELEDGSEAWLYEPPQAPQAPQASGWASCVTPKGSP